MTAPESLDDGGAVTEYEVAWFPPDVAQRTTRTYDEDKARKAYDRERELGTNPILSSRRVTAGPWHVDANAALP